MVCLTVAGEMVFGLAFHVPRYFRPTLLAALGISNAQLGDSFALYGILAMVSYFPSGLLADRFGARSLMSLSLVATGAGGLYFATLPGWAGLSALYAFWGVTTVALMWGALIRATREWGGRTEQGRGFGLLDGGRGLVAALAASGGVGLLSLGLGQDPAGAASEAARASALRGVILYYSCATFGAAALVHLWTPEAARLARTQQLRPPKALQVVSMPAVWLQAGIVVCAYCGYKAFDNYSLYGHEVLNMNEAEAAGFAAAAAYLRPVAAIGAGYAGDRLGVAGSTMALFAALAGCWTLLGLPGGELAGASLSYGALLTSIAAAFGLRGLYFALLEHTRVPHSVTGTAVGLISLLGYTPDIFFGPVTGRILDATPGAGGHRQCFLLLAATAVAGLLATAALRRRMTGSPIPSSG